jgi:predicted dienelactone hydrolase
MRDQLSLVSACCQTMKTATVIHYYTLLLISLLAGVTACSDSSSGPSTVSSEPMEVAAAPGAIGPFGVGHSSFSAIDHLRDNRMLAVEVWYPVDLDDRRDSPLTIYPLAGPIGMESDVAVDELPVSARPNQSLLVFSHGLGGISIQSVKLTEALASHGFIVISPEHTGNAQDSNTQTFNEAAISRVPDVSFLIDTMLERSQDRDDMFYNRIAEKKVGVIGHSFGGMTALGMAAGWAGAAPDSRVEAIVPISAVIRPELQKDDRSGEAYAGFSPKQLASITVPTMLVGGTDDTDVFIENNSIAFSEIANAPRVYQLNIVGANHNHFAGVCDIGNLLIGLGIGQDSWPDIGAAELLEPYASACGPGAFPMEKVSRLQNLYAVAFFRRHLQDDARYDTYLSGEYADSEPDVELFVK